MRRRAPACGALHGARPISPPTQCTVAIPVYNQRRFIARAVSSALTQVVAGLTVLVVDNCSDDGTWEALQAFLPKGVVLHRNPRNLGLFANFNRCLDLARSPYLRFLSADDVLLPGCLAAELDLMRRHPQVVMVSSRGRFISPDGRRLGN